MWEPVFSQKLVRCRQRVEAARRRLVSSDVTQDLCIRWMAHTPNLHILRQCRWTYTSGLNYIVSPFSGEALTVVEAAG